MSKQNQSQGTEILDWICELKHPHAGPHKLKKPKPENKPLDLFGGKNP